MRRIILCLFIAASGVLGGSGVAAHAAPGRVSVVLAATQLCSDAYPDFCIPPPQPDLNCEDIDYSDFTVLVPDPHRLDPDNNGRGCEGSGKPRFGGQIPFSTSTAPGPTAPSSTAASSTTAPTTSTTRPVTTTSSAPTTTTSGATTTTTVAGVATTGVDTDRRVLGASLLICVGLSLVMIGAWQRTLRLD